MEGAPAGAQVQHKRVPLLQQNDTEMKQIVNCGGKRDVYKRLERTVGTEGTKAAVGYDTRDEGGLLLWDEKDVCDR